MGSVQGERQCPKCGNNSAVYINYYKTYEYCFLCPQCNWGYEIRARWFAQDTLHQLRKLMRDDLAAEAEDVDLYRSHLSHGKERVSKVRKSVQDKPWSEAGPQIERILAVLLSESKAHGYDPDEVRKFEDIKVRKLEDMLKRSISQWQDSDWSYIRELSERWALQELENGELAFDYIEEPPKLMEVPYSALRPISELRIKDGEKEYELKTHFGSEEK